MRAPRPYIIYCCTHVASGRQYVGQTKQTMTMRWRGHVAYAHAGRGAAFGRAIREALTMKPPMTTNHAP